MPIKLLPDDAAAQWPSVYRDFCGMEIGIEGSIIACKDPSMIFAADEDWVTYCHSKESKDFIYNEASGVWPITCQEAVTNYVANHPWGCDCMMDAFFQGVGPLPDVHLALAAPPGPDARALINPCSERTDIDLNELGNGGGCIDVKTEEECTTIMNEDGWMYCREEYGKRGGGCALSCMKSFQWSPDDSVLAKDDGGNCKYYWDDCDGSPMPDYVAAQPTEYGVLSTGEEFYFRCEPKPNLKDSYLHDSDVQCGKAEVIYNRVKCSQFQSYCNYVMKFGAPDSSEYKRLTEEQLFGGQNSEVLNAGYSGESFNLFAVSAVPDSTLTYRLGYEPKTAVPQRKSKWVFWNYDVLTDPLFRELGCDCLEGERVEDPEHWFINVSTNCAMECSRYSLGSDAKLFSIYTVHDKVCHRDWV